MIKHAITLIALTATLNAQDYPAAAWKLNGNTLDGVTLIDDAGAGRATRLLSANITWEQVESFVATGDVAAVRAEITELKNAAVQAAKSDALKAAENKFYTLCFSLYGNYDKRGFDEISATIEALVDSDPINGMKASIRFLAIDAECKREGGLEWWDTAERHVAP